MPCLRLAPAGPVLTPTLRALNVNRGRQRLAAQPRDQVLRTDVRHAVAPRPQVALGRITGVDVVVEHAHVPAAAAALRQRIADPAHADDAEGATGEVLAEMAERLPCLPAARQRVLVPLDQPARGADEQA